MNGRRVLRRRRRVDLIESQRSTRGSAFCAAAWEALPPSSDPEHPPGTRVWKGQPGTLHIEGPRCWFCPVGGELCRLFAQKQVGPDHGNVNPETFPLDQLHRDPVPFVALAHELDRRFTAVLTPPTQLQPPTWRAVWQAVARGWVKELARYAERPHRKKWVARLRMELDAVEAELCPGLCIDPYRDAYYVANAAHQWAMLASGGQAKPPTVTYDAGTVLRFFRTTKEATAGAGRAAATKAAELVDTALKEAKQLKDDIRDSTMPLVWVFAGSLAVVAWIQYEKRSQ